MINTLTIIFSSFILFSWTSTLAESTHEKQATPGKSYICQFGKYGVVVIDTRDPGASISIDGVRYPATDGSYFYQTVDGKIAIAFNPKMTKWTLMSEEDSKEITDAHCKVKFNNK